ncbi:NAD(P)/FAD-dependent oxidoreductase [Rhizobium leguminosarum]|uniref:NAD(P)/FAD-dependent oxidoreductase n=1 Tax=Rhizobium leguminosarum TaxID=384 RepID=UPI003F94CBD3
MKEVSRFPAPVGDLGWFNIANNREHRFANPEAIADSYDFVVVGAGFGGVNAASRLAENRPGASIALLDALRVGMGDSGRSAGLMIDVPHVTVGDPKMDLEHHKWRYRLNKIVIDRMRDIKSKNNLQVDWRESGKHLAARESSCLPSLDSLARFLDRMGSSSRMIEKADIPPVLGTDYYIRSLYTPGTILINPAEVVRGLAMSLPQNVQVFEQTPVLQVVEGPVPLVRLTNGKTIKAGKIILTISAFINNFGIKEAGRLYGVNSFGAFTRELTDDELAHFRGIEPWGATAAHPAGTTVRYTASKRIFVRNGFQFSPNQITSPERVHQARGKLRKAFVSRFPKLAHVNFEYVYGGMIPLSFNTQSLFGDVAQNVVAGTVGDGLGITRSSMLGLYLADMVCGIDSEELRYMSKTNTPSWCPPDPFRTLGATVRLAYDEYRAGGEI